ncbi:probable lipase precursor [Sporisorium reilianum SRZ2]|uniref:Lipase n=1 Tax=Sporisorium reilianum (strain SRZ2) TaxID=999809 RepID=E7A3D1_SPORE|nr:probable lipase precursor [Sporisorium reilianum SRZ2]
MRFFAQTLVALAAAATVSLAAPLERRAQFPDPNDDPFYSAPANIGSYVNGQVIQSRSATTDIGTSNNAASFQLLYRTTNTSNLPEATVATVWIPAKPASPPKIFSYQVYEDATQLNCAPSYSYLSGLDEPGKGTVILDTPIVISWALQQGYYVVSADHEGPKAAFIAGCQEGRAILDGVRALRNFQNLASNSAVGFYGYSGGGHATGWAVSLAGSYAPDVNIIGAAYGGVPTSTRDIFNFLNGGAFAGFAVAGVSGLGLAYPELEAYIEPRLNAKGQDALKRFRSRGYCIGQVVTSENFVDIYTLVNDSNILNEPIPSQVLAKETLLQTQASYTVPVPKSPRFIWHALEDEIVPFKPAQQYVTEQCAKGANINWNVFPIAEHISAELFGLVPGLDWLSKAYRGQAPKVICGSSIPAITGVNSPSAQQVLGADLAQQLSNLNGKQSAFGKPYGPITPPTA